MTYFSAPILTKRIIKYNKKNFRPLLKGKESIGLKDSGNKTVSGTQQHYELPEERVLFLGGHPNMVSKLRILHPGWVFLFPADCSARVGVSETGAKTLLIIKFTKTLAHKIERSVKIPKETPVIYVSCVNLKLLEKEIQERWDMICRRREE